MRGKPRFERCGTRGFTLLEMLVTLVVVSMIVAVMRQALAQLARIEQLLAGAQLRSVASSLRAEWVRSAIESLLPGRRDSDERLRGDQHELRGLSADVPQLPAPGLSRLHLRLVFQDSSGLNELQMQLPTNDPLSSSWIVLLSWPGREGQFRYLDRGQTWHDQWPPALASDDEPLPVAIALETGLPEVRALIARLRATEQPLPTRSQLESL